MVGGQRQHGHLLVPKNEFILYAHCKSQSVYASVLSCLVLTMTVTEQITTSGIKKERKKTKEDELITTYK